MSELRSKEIGKRISSVRKAKKLTQKEIADLLKVTPKHISHVECGTSNLSLSQLVTFCEYTDTSLDYIVLGNSNSAPLSLLPDEIIDILNGDSADNITILQRYLRMFVELYNLQPL